MYVCADGQQKPQPSSTTLLYPKHTQAIKTMKEPVEQWVWVSDFHGFGFQDLNPGIAKVYVRLFKQVYVKEHCSYNNPQHRFAEMSGSHYPERLGTFLAIDAPRMFNTLWKVVSQIVDPITKAKVKFLPYDVKAGSKSVLREELLRYFDEELTDWLLREMGENRNKSIAKVKVLLWEDTYVLSAACAQFSTFVHMFSHIFAQQMYSYDDLAKAASEPLRTVASMPTHLVCQE